MWALRHDLRDQVVESFDRRRVAQQLRKKRLERKQVKQSIVSGLIGGRVARGLAIGASLAQGSGAVHVNVEASLNQLKLSTALIAIPLTTQLLNPGQDFEAEYYIQNLVTQPLASIRAGALDAEPAEPAGPPEAPAGDDQDAAPKAKAKALQKGMEPF